MLPPQYQNDIPIYWQKVSFRCVVALLETFLFTDMKENNFILIPAFMRTKLNLKGSELIIASLIYGFSQDNETWFSGSTKYIADWAGIAEKNVLRNLKELVERGILIKKDVAVNNLAKKCYYKFNMISVSKIETKITELQNVSGEVSELQNVSRAELQNIPNPDLQNVSVYNIDNKNIDVYNIVAETEFSATSEGNEDFSLNQESEKLRGTTEPRKCLFANSRFSKFEDFEKCFTAPEFEKIDMVYYFNALADWSASKGRMQKDWIAQARNFIRGDERKGMLRLKPQYKTTSSSFNVQDMLDCLNDKFD